MKVIVITGSRSWVDRPAIEAILSGADGLIVGDCPTGADAIAQAIAKAWDIIPRVQWVKGQRTPANLLARNQTIADEALVARDEGFDVQCHALPLADSRGTWHCAGLLKKHGFVVEVHRG